MSTPAALYRNAIDLNRYSNSVARRVMNAYNDIIIDAANQLRTIDELTAPVKAARLRSILAQLKESLGTWAGDATEITALELQGLTELQSEFVTEQLRQGATGWRQGCSAHRGDQPAICAVGGHY
jgi:hypothetical protein